MLDFLLAIATSLPALVLSGGIGAAAVVASFFGLIPAPWGIVAKWGGRVLLCAAIFIVGYRAADDHAAQKAEIDRLTAVNTDLTSQLGLQKLIAADASAERDRLRDLHNNDQGALEKYKQDLQSQPKAGPDACAIDDTDLHFRRSLRH